MATSRFTNANLFPGEPAELSEPESDASSIDINMKPPSPASREQLIKRMESLVQENRVLKIEMDALKIRVRNLTVENKMLREASVQIQVKAEQEEEFISNTLLKKIQDLKKEKEALALNYEQEEECLTNDLSRKLCRLRQEKEELSSTLHQEQESMVSKLIKRIKKLEAETNAKQMHLEQLRREKVELENTLEQEQEALVNRLWKRLDNLESEKQFLQRKLEQPVTAPPSPMDSSAPVNLSAENAAMTNLPKHRAASIDVPPVPETSGSHPMLLARDIIRMRGEVMHLRQQLRISQTEHAEKTAQFAREEQQIREENSRLHKRLQLEIERREQLCQNLSESESSLEIVVDEERASNLGAAANDQQEGVPTGEGRRRRMSNRNRSEGGAYSPMQIVPPAYVMRPISPAGAGCSSTKYLQMGIERPSPNQGSGAILCPSAVVGRCPSCGFQIPRCQVDQPTISENQQSGSSSRQENFIKPAIPSAASPRNSFSTKSPSCDSSDDISPKK